MIGSQTGGDFYAEPIVGYRLWRVTEDADLTGAMVTGYTWPPVEDASAECRPAGYSYICTSASPHHPRAVPVKDCMCGFYGYWSYEILQTAQTCWANHIKTVRGVVIGWGKTWTAERGWKAKYARPVAFLHWPERRNAITREFGPEHYDDAFKWNEIIEQTAEKYGVSIVHSPAELDEAVRTYMQ